ncbi:hypothetical protein BJ965_000217 [Streptomyces luteogriseus]|uniref:Aromatic amino acid beta-eliminating lyase/threonine aldolase domain-containing protein n=1 Tax=Streptomyces luteogriseus TaxID=68233 RepID=A0A7W7DGW4_9ACTN|nr:hypothetical protein [Streptomyces luteogriseus]
MRPWRTRVAENTWLVTQHEAAYRDMSPRQVAEQAFRRADGCMMSAKKDGIVHIGGFLGLRDRSPGRAVRAAAHRHGRLSHLQAPLSQQHPTNWSGSRSPAERTASAT